MITSSSPVSSDLHPSSFSNPLVSVIIPTYNRAQLLPRAVGSVLEQSVRALEVVIVDDSSSDDTEDVVAAFADDRVRYIRHEVNRGAPIAKNTGILAARGTYIGLLDSDDAYLPGKLERQLAEFDRRGPECGVVYSGWEWVSDTTGQILNVRQPDDDGYIDRMSRWAFNVGPGLLVRGDLLKKSLYGSDILNYEHIDLLLRLRMETSFASVPEVLVRLYSHDGERMSDAIAQGAWELETLIETYREIIWSDRRAASHLALRAGALFLGPATDQGRARRHLLRAALADPTSLRVWKFLALSLTPSSLWPVRVSARVKRRSARAL